MAATVNKAMANSMGVATLRQPVLKDFLRNCATHITFSRLAAANYPPDMDLCLLCAVLRTSAAPQSIVDPHPHHHSAGVGHP